MPLEDERTKALFVCEKIALSTVSPSNCPTVRASRDCVNRFNHPSFIHSSIHLHPSSLHHPNLLSIFSFLHIPNLYIICLSESSKGDWETDVLIVDLDLQS